MGEKKPKKHKKNELWRFWAAAEKSAALLTRSLLEKGWKGRSWKGVTASAAGPQPSGLCGSGGSLKESSGAVILPREK